MAPIIPSDQVSFGIKTLPPNLSFPPAKGSTLLPPQIIIKNAIENHSNGFSEDLESSPQSIEESPGRGSISMVSSFVTVAIENLPTVAPASISEAQPQSMGERQPPVPLIESTENFIKSTVLKPEPVVPLPQSKSDENHEDVIRGEGARSPRPLESATTMIPPTFNPENFELAATRRVGFFVNYDFMQIFEI